jgi:plastocyanin
MKVKHMLVTAVALGAVAAGTASAGTTASHTILIRHQLRGCHAWSVDGSAFKATQSLVVRRDGTITVTNNDVMPHQLVKTSGPAVLMTAVKTPMGMDLKGTFAPSMLAHMGATVRVTFTHPGVYRFKTKAGEDYMAGMKTIGEDNLLQLKVTVL